MSDAVKNQVLVQRLISLIDLTSLNDTDTESSIAAFCEKAQTDLGPVAAVCVYPQFARLVAAQFANTHIKTATVVNFPQGTDTIESVLAAISRALQDGAQEIDVVFPYQQYLDGARDEAQSFIAACKAVCGPEVCLKVILETGALQDAAIIAAASRDVLTAGADFIKTSTGKIPHGATLEAATIMLLTIRELVPQLKRPLGFKVSGGIREFTQATQYLDLAGTIMGPKWATPQTFRIGASKLLDELIQM